MESLLRTLADIVGRAYLLTGESRTRRFSTGYRFGSGAVLAVVKPADAVQQFEVFKACIAAEVIVIVQAANTGLTGGSTPFGEYDRPVVIINTMRIKGLTWLPGPQQVVCLAGSTLHELERTLAPLGREPHSVIGSSCIGASVVGGICNNSGGSLVRRGPAYTELALYARATDDGRVELVNHLGIDLGIEPEIALARLSSGNFAPDLVEPVAGAASSTDYEQIIRDICADSPARYNADPARLFEASGSAGKVMVLAVRLDTFPKDRRSATFYIGTNNPAQLGELRRRILSECQTLPVSGEYIHRDAFDVATVYGKDVFVAIERFGTDRLPLFFALKSKIDQLGTRLPFLPQFLADRLLQAASRLFPNHLPPRMIEWRDRFEHHLILKTSDEGIEEARALIDAVLPVGSWFECTPTEAAKAFLQRFAVASAAIRYRAIHRKQVGEVVALDIALRRNEVNWLESLPQPIRSKIDKALYYGHFLCHVFHQDYVLKADVDPVALEHELLSLLDDRGARYPAEHNVGHLYVAGDEQEAHFRALDPGNCLNPGIGQTSRNRCWH